MLPTTFSMWHLWGLAQGTCIGLCGFVLLSLGQRLSPSLRARCALLTLLLMGLAPLLLLLPIDHWTKQLVIASRTTPPADSETVPTDPNFKRMGVWLDSFASQDFQLSAFRQVQSLETPSTLPASNNVREPGSAMLWSYLSWIAVSLIACSTIGFARLIFGRWQVRRLIRRAAPLAEEELLNTTAALSKQFAFRREICLRESTNLTSPVVMGWLRPVIIVPVDWRNWSKEQLRAALAHEIAHLSRCDTLVNSLAQPVLAANFFHPLAHWLVMTLRLNQELAADDMAASVAGGREAYLQHLASLALRGSQRSVVSPALAFLPTRHTLIRRLEMLKSLPTPSFWGKIYLAFVVPSLLCLATCVVTTVRPVNAQQPSR